MGARWIVYDWFKLIVLLILIALLLLVRGCSGQACLLPDATQDGSAQAGAPAESAAAPAGESAAAGEDASASESASAADGTESSTGAEGAGASASADASDGSTNSADGTGTSPTEDASGTAENAEGSEDATPDDVTKETAQAPAADGAQDGAQSAGGATAAELSAACDMALPVRLSGTGMRARVTNATLTLRSSPEVANNVLGFMLVGSEVDVSALPVCTPYLEGANNWWQVETDAGIVGYAAEGSAVNPVYYLEEIK